MSTNSECEFVKWKKKWYYTLEDYNAPKNAWDWYEYSSTYGPFASQDEADEHLRDNHANPGGASIAELPDDIDGATRARLEGAISGRRLSSIFR